MTQSLNPFAFSPPDHAILEQLGAKEQAHASEHQSVKQATTRGEDETSTGSEDDGECADQLYVVLGMLPHDRLGKFLSQVRNSEKHAL